MTLRRFTLFSGVTALAIFGLTRQAHTPPGHWKLAPAKASESERVRIEEEIVRIPVTTPPPAAARRVAAKAPSARPGSLRRPAVEEKASPALPDARPRSAARKAEPGADAGFLSRAVRTVVGDGRHRPQPFPTVEKEIRRP